MLNQCSLVASVHFPYKFIHDGVLEYFDIIDEMKKEPKVTTRFLTKVCEFTCKLNAHMLVIHSGGEKVANVSRTQAHDRLIETLERLVAVAECQGLTLALENSDARDNRLCQTIDEINYVLHGVDSDNLGICFDTAHAFSCGLKVAPSIVCLSKNIVHFHLNDSVGGVGWKEHLAVGSGLIDWKETIAAIHGIGFTGLSILEGGMAGTKENTDSGLLQQKEYVFRLVRTRGILAEKRALGMDVSP
jgi:sugar phosphate isomerase/epimerase